MTDWYRNDTWDEEISARFFERLARSRSQRDQYLVIQAIHLEAVRPKVALELLDIYLQTKKGSFDDNRAHCARAHAFINLGDHANAISAFKAALAAEALRPHSKTNARLEYPYLVAEFHIVGEFDDAVRVLDLMPSEPSPFPLSRFREHAARALIAAEKGLKSFAKEQALIAIRSASSPSSDFPNDPDLGLVPQSFAPMVRRIQAIAGV